MTESPPPRQPVAGPAPKEGSLGIWYAILIGAVLLIAVGAYTAHLHRQLTEAQDAIEQLTLGQELLRADRDDILRKAREREGTLATLEVERERDRIRLEGLEAQRRRLQDDVVSLTQALAESEQRSAGAAMDSGETEARDRLERERARLERALAQRDADLAGLQITLDEIGSADEAKEAAIEVLRAENAELEQAIETSRAGETRAREQLAAGREDARRRQIIRGHRASLGEVRPYIAELGPGDWSVIESWLALQLGRPMAIPDLADHGLSYEGARLIGHADGPPMVMLLYADGDQRPVSLTIASDRRGEKPLATRERAGLNLVDWREERHAFTLAGALDQDRLEAIGIDLLNQPPRLSEDAAVPTSRHVRPVLRPAASP